MNTRPLYIIVFLTCVTCLFAQESPEERRTELTVGGGFTSMPMRNVNEAIRQSVQFYRSNNIPIPVQQRFSGGPTGSIDLLYAFGTGVVTGFQAEYQVLTAQSAYRDPNGSIDLRTELALWNIDLFIGLEAEPLRGIMTRAGFRMGNSWYSYHTLEKVVITPFPSSGLHESMTADGTGWYAAPTVECSVPAGPVVFVLSSAWRCSAAAELEGKYVRTDGSQVIKDVPLDADASGLTVGLRIGWVW